MNDEKVKVILSVPRMRITIGIFDGKKLMDKYKLNLTKNEFLILYNLILYSKMYSDKEFRLGHISIGISSANAYRSAIFNFKNKLPEKIKERILVTGKGSYDYSLYKLHKNTEFTLEDVSKRQPSEMDGYRVFA